MSAGKRIADFLGVYYGWIIVIVAMISMAFWYGVRSSFSVFYVALLEEFPWSRGESAGVQSLALITYTVMSPIVGGLIDRYGPRRVIVPGVFVLGLGLILCSFMKTLTQFYILYGIVAGAGISCIAIVAFSAILAHWFEEKRGLASGLAVSGMGLGTFILVPSSQYFINLWGWRFTFVILGGLVLIILLPLNGIFLRHKPGELGLYPDGSPGPGPGVGKDRDAPEAQETMDREWTLKKASKTLSFWALLAFPFLAFIGTFIIHVHNVKFLVDQGIDKMTAAFVYAMIGVISSVFRIIWGGLSDRIGREFTYFMGIMCACLGIFSLILIEMSGERLFVYPFFIFFGMGWGVTAPIFMSAAADLFKGRIFGLIYGIVEGGIGVAGALGAWIAGFIFDKTQSYHWAFVLAIVVILASGILCWFAAPRKFHPGRKNNIQ
ncbi:MAG: MFS transporter [Deltaproteobacteria bacterium]|nr:MFS transporter [Deltaproteobacteria bacterium]MBW2137850.1 MFS transporter [Deltaproteobacteria bacterium]